MSKITRYTGDLKAFGSGAVGTERTVFGAATQSDTIDANVNADFLRGWENGTDVNGYPTKQFFNAMGFTSTQIIAYLHQMGIAEYDAAQEYHIGSLCNVGGIIFGSLTNTNIGNDPATDFVNWRTISAPAGLLLSQFTSIHAAITAIGSAETELVIDTDAVMTQNDATPKTLGLKFVKGNTVSGAFTLTVGGGIDAGPFKIFESTVTVEGASDCAVEKTYSEWWGAKMDGATDDTTPIQAAIYSGLSTDIYFLEGTYRVTNLSINALVHDYPVNLIGQGGLSEKTIFESEALTGAVLEVRRKFSEVRGIMFSATATRKAATPSYGHGIYHHTAWRCKFEDILVVNQPTDGLYAKGTVEHSLYDRIWITDCVRFGFCFDDGTRSADGAGTTRPFNWVMNECRAIECGGNALVIGSSVDTTKCYGGTFINFEALGCAWDSTKRHVAHVQIYNRGKNMVFINMDVEDQQYAETETAYSGSPRDSLAAPSIGVYSLNENQHYITPFFSSLLYSMNITDEAKGVKVENPKIFGTGGVSQPVCFYIRNGAIGTRIHATTSTALYADRMIQNEDPSTRYWIDGVEYVGTTDYRYDEKINKVADTVAIASGSLTSDSTLIEITGESDTTDSVAYFRWTGNSTPTNGQRRTILHGGGATYDITIVHGTGNIKTISGSDVVMSSTANIALDFVFNDLFWWQM